MQDMALNGAHRAPIDTTGHGERIANKAMPRHDLYSFAHKGLRLFLGDVLAAVGRMDVTDDGEVAHTLTQVRELLSLCRIHLQKEEHFLHPAMEARRPGSAAHTARDHVGHERSFAALEHDTRAVLQSQGTQRAAAALKLYRQLALFVAENLAHMHTEETESNEVLWAMHTDEELRAIQAALVAAIPPPERLVFLRWMVAAMAPHERTPLLAGMKPGMPAPAFAAILATVKPHLAERDWNTLTAALAGL
jgi:hypothetical protein